MDHILLDVVMLEDGQLGRRVVDVVVGGTQGLQS